MTVNGITITIRDSTLNGIMIGNGDNTDKIVIGEEDPHCSRDFVSWIIVFVPSLISVG